MFKAFLIKYGEIGIKGKNRHLFEDALIQQIKYALRPVEGDFLITKESMLAQANQSTQGILSLLG